MSRLATDQANKKIWGVCAGLSNFTGVDVSIIRILFIVATLIGFGSPILLYILLALVLD